MKQVILVFATAIYLLSCQNQPASKWETQKFIQDNPSLTQINLGDTAHDHGDGIAWESPLRDTIGNIVGEAYGLLITIDIMDGDSANPSYIRERIGTSVFNFGDENEIIYDPFSGTGTTALASLMEKRLYIGSEIDKTYYDLSTKRLNNFLQQQTLF